MLYKGYFKTNKEESILVEIITGNSTENDSIVTDLVFSGESPVIISTESDGLFSPIKSRSCTVTLVAEQPYYDMYSGTSHGTKLHVYNCDTAECLFYGYVTPCAYSQPYNYLNTIEIEAVDALSTLQDYQYKYLSSNNDPSIVTIADLLKYCISFAEYPGRILVPFDGHKMSIAKQMNKYPFELEMINDDNFFEDNEDHDSMTCYEIIEEICNFYGMTLVPMGEDLIFIDYERISKATSSNNVFKWKDIKDGKVYDIDVLAPTLTIDSYAGEDQTIELDEVYNKAIVTADIYDVDSDKACPQLYDDSKFFTYYKLWSSGTNKNGDPDYEFQNRYYYLWEKTSFDYLNKTSMWQNYKNQWFNNFYSFYDNFNYPLDKPDYDSGRSWPLPFYGIGCMPFQYYVHKAEDVIPVDQNWNDMMMFNYESEAVMNKYTNNSISGTASENYWLDTFYNDNWGKKPVLTLHAADDLVFSSPLKSGKRGYFLFKGDLLWSVYTEYDKTRYHVWSDNGGVCMLPLKDAMGLNQQWAGSNHRPALNVTGIGINGVIVNRGWDILKCRLSVGDKYWNGTYWVTSPSTFWIPYHEKDVKDGKEERMMWNQWNKPVTNHDYTCGISDECWAIPVNDTDYLMGEVKFEIFMPRIPWHNQIKTNNGYIKFDDFKGRMTPCAFMQNLSFEFKMCDTETNYIYGYISDDDSDDDVEYSNVIYDNNVTEMDDLKLKINTHNVVKPFAKSYIIEPTYSNNTIQLPYKYHTDGFYDASEDVVRRQEYNIVHKYVEHYRNPKKIYNCVVHGYFNPFEQVQATCLPNTKLCVDEQSYSVKEDINEVKLIEY